MSADSWCVIYLNGEEVKVNIRHVGRGKFTILEDEGKSNVGRLVDASDIIFCIDPKLAKARANEMTKQARAITERYLSGSIDKAKAKADFNRLIDEI